MDVWGDESEDADVDEGLGVDEGLLGREWT